MKIKPRYKMEFLSELADDENEKGGWSVYDSTNPQAGSIETFSNRSQAMDFKNKLNNPKEETK
jgi:hypothetical protein